MLISKLKPALIKLNPELPESAIDEAIKVFKENVKRFPASSNVYDSLGEAYEYDGQLTEAEKNYAKAVEIGEKEQHAFLETYKVNLNRIKVLLAEK